MFHMLSGKIRIPQPLYHINLPIEHFPRDVHRGGFVGRKKSLRAASNSCALLPA